VRRSRLIAAIGALGLGVGIVAVFFPGVLPPQLAALVNRVAELSNLGTLALLAGGIAILQGLWSSGTPSAPPKLPVSPGDRELNAVGPFVGERFDEYLAATGRIAQRTAKAESMVREDLRRLAVDVYQQAHDCDWETAARAIEEGTWTDDSAAAAFVGGPDAPSVPLHVWFGDVLSDAGAFYRQTTRTIREIYTMQAEVESGRRERPTHLESVGEGEESPLVPRLDLDTDSASGDAVDTATEMDDTAEGSEP
jgi:hypothetical protein